ncbi:hypothetical protein HY227_01375 [Candidatus Wolfebacteria bacterium]|nr:hypothetical protein [Candidatus Wolfebacteria bacterium]
MIFFLNYIIAWLPRIFWVFVFILTLILYARKLNDEADGRRKKYYKFLIAVSIAFHIFYAFVLTIGQYYMWSQNKLTQLLLNSPINNSLPAANFPFSDTRLGYFLFYSYGRFWLKIIISIGVAFAFYAFLKFLKKYKERFFRDGEVELGFLTALIAGWPNFVMFLPLVFLSVVLIAIFRRVILKEEYTTLGWPFLLASLLTLIWGYKLIEIFKLGMLKI